MAATFKFGSVACELTREQHETITAAATATTTTPTTTITTTQSILDSFPTYAKSLQCFCLNYNTTTFFFLNIHGSVHRGMNQ